MEKILYSIVDIFGIVVLLTMLFSYVIKAKINRSFDQIIFKILIITNIAILGFDLVMYLLDGKLFFSSKFLSYIFANLYYISQIVICFFWLLFCCFKLDEDLEKLKKKIKFYIIPILLAVIMLITNYFLPFIFYIDEANVYQRMPFMISFMLVAFIYLAYAVILVLIKTNNTKINNANRKYLTIFPIPPLIAVVIQFCIYGISIIWISSIISLLIIFFNYQNEQIKTDALTGLNNRNRFNHYIHNAAKTLSSSETLFLINMDIDRFKIINDTYGHNIGDEALCNNAKILTLSLRHNDFLSRIGGDEFVIVGKTKNEKDIENLIKKIEQNVSSFNDKRNKKEYKLSLSFGYSILHRNNIKTINELMIDADKKMYEQKEKNRKDA